MSDSIPPPPGTPLTLVEEVLLLALDDATGDLRPMPVMGLEYSLAGALLADLALAERIDSDPQQIIVLSSEPTGDPLLDEPLATLAASTGPLPVAHWLRVLAGEAQSLENAARARLIARGILREEKRKLLWVLGNRRYPTADDRELVEVRTRLSALILGDDLPDPRDAILIGLLTASRLLNHLFPEAAIQAREGRIATLARMDLVGREVSTAVEAIVKLISSSALSLRL